MFPTIYPAMFSELIVAWVMLGQLPKELYGPVTAYRSQNTKTIMFCAKLNNFTRVTNMPLFWRGIRMYPSKTVQIS